MIIVRPWTHNHTNARTHLHTHMLLCLGEQRPEPAGSHNSTEEEEYQTTGSFFCRGLQKPVITLQELCRRGQEISPHWDSTVMWERARSQSWKTKRLEVFRWGQGGNSVHVAIWGESSKPIFKPIRKRGYIKQPRELIDKQNGDFIYTWPPSPPVSRLAALIRSPAVCTSCVPQTVSLGETNISPGVLV